MSKISNAIAEKLLEGYTLLEEHCPVTKSVPLLLDPSTGRKWSAEIGYVEEKNSNENKDRQEDRSEENETIIIEDNNDELGDESIIFSPSSVASRRSADSSSSPPPSSKIDDKTQILAQTVDALYVKIDAARQLLVSTRDISQSRTAAALINECGVAIKALEKINNF